MSTERLTEITRERYETGAYGNALLMMSRATLAAIPRPEPRPYETPVGAAVRLWDIPILLDASLPLGAWRLLDRTTGEEIESEGFAAARSEGYAQARAEDIAALRDRDRWLEWWKTHPLTSFDEHLNDRAATYLASLTPTQEAPDDDPGV